MGCCIGKLRTGSGKHQTSDVFHQKQVDKAVITEAPAPLMMSPSSITYSSLYSLSSSSLMPESSSVLSMNNENDQTFSKEFLVTRLKENHPQVVTQVNQTHIPSPTHSVLISRTHTKVFDYRAKSIDQPASRNSLGPRAPHRLEWQTSPSPARRKCPLTRDQEMLLPNYYGPSRKASLLRSPSPSQRFNNDCSRAGEYKQKRVKRAVGSGQQPPVFNDHALSGVYSKRHRGSTTLKPCASSPGRNLLVSSSALTGEMECMPLEDDIDNPHISLDCFIFL